MSGRFVELTVADTGPGIAPEVLERMFEPFYTTKEVGKGSGMGLSMVHGIVHEYGGHLLVETAPGTGTAFRELFPSLAASVEPMGAVAEAATDPGERRGPRGRVVLVDDEPTVAEFMQDLLEEWGLAVAAFTSSPEARDAFARDPIAFDLAILDQTMPRLTGLELAQILLQRRPDLPVILYTGYQEAFTDEEVRPLAIRALARKPVDVAEFHPLVEALLPSAPPSVARR